MLSSLPRHDWILSRHILLVCAYVGFAVLTLWVTSVTSAPLPLTRGKRIILSRNKHSRAPFYRCKLLGNGSSLHSFDAAHTDDQIWDRNKRWTECVLSPLLSRITLSCTPLYFKALPFLLHCRFQPSSPLFSIPLVTPPLCFQTENARWANAIHSFTKGKLGLLLQGSDRLVPEAKFYFSFNRLTC